MHHLDDVDRIFRATNRSSYDRESGSFAAKAFMRRPAPNDELGLSVDHHCEPEAAAPHREKIIIAALTVGGVRQIDCPGIDVIPDTDTHANIVNVPRREEDELLAESVADDLARLASYAGERKERLIPPN